MGLKTFGHGWDPGSGWAPDDSTSQNGIRRSTFPVDGLMANLYPT